MKVGVLEIKTLKKEFYCRHCKSYSRCVGKGHRNGIWFKILVRNTETGGKAIFVVGMGEKEGDFPFGLDPGKLIRRDFSGAETYEKGHATCGGWYSIFTPIVLSEEESKEENEEVELNESEKIVLAECLERDARDILLTLLKKGVVDIFDDLGLWNKYKPLLYTFIRQRDFQLPHGAEIREIPKSFTAKFKFGAIEFNIPKGRYHIEDYDICEYTTVSVGKAKIYYARVHDRKIVYYFRDFNNFSVAIGYEQYYQHLHQPAEIAMDYFNPNDLFHMRLGDLIFAELDKPYPLANEEQVRKVQLLNAEIVKENGKLVLKPTSDSARIVLYHPEHGVLELPNIASYTIYGVPYVQRGHD